MLFNSIDEPAKKRIGPCASLQFFAKESGAGFVWVAADVRHAQRITSTPLRHQDRMRKKSRQHVE